jgi:site-specific recombinase XerD
MLTTYRRHLKDCDHRGEGRKYRRCRCPIWVDGFVAGREIRKSVGTRDWEKAQDMIREWEAAGELSASDAGEPVTIEELRKIYLDNAENGRKLKGTTVDRYRIIFRQLEKFAEEKGIRFVRELDFAKLLQFRGSWKDGALSGQKKLERLRAIFGFAKKMKIVADNPALELEMPIVRQVPTLPFTQEEMGRILVAVEKKITTAATAGQRRKWRRVRALVLFLRYSGLRISDAVGCGVERIRDGKLFLYTAKTGQEVYVPLPEMVVKAVEECEPVHECYWFWTARGTVETARKKWSEALARVFRDAKVKDGHAHRFRDTFAVELLKKGTPIENVAAFLGHASVRTTQKHYAAWVKARQERAEADVLASWESDPLLIMERPTKGTYKVHKNGEVVN